MFARDKLRVAVVALFLLHLHLLCDFVGSRGPSSEDLWPIVYFGPFDQDPMWLWKGQWLDGWQNQLVSVACFGSALWLAVRAGLSPLGAFHRRSDAVFVSVLRGWKEGIKKRFTA